MNKPVSTPKMAKRKLPRDPGSGRFEVPSPQNDPALLDQAVRWVRAIDQLHPLFEFASKQKGGDDRNVAVHRLVAEMLTAYKKSFIEGLSLADDKEYLRRAKNPLVTASHRYPKPQKAVDDVTFVEGGDST